MIRTILGYVLAVFVMHRAGTAVFQICGIPAYQVVFDLYWFNLSNVLNLALVLLAGAGAVIFFMWFCQPIFQKLYNFTGRVAQQSHPLASSAIVVILACVAGRILF